MKIIFLTVLLAAALTLLGGCAATQSSPVAASPTILRVGVAPNAPPMIFKEGGQVAGVEAELAQALASQNADLFLSDSPMIRHLSSRYESKGLTVAPMIFNEEYLGWGVRRTDNGLHEAANAFLKKAQDGGDLRRVLKRWMPGFQRVFHGNDACNPQQA